ncbi:MAG: MerR family transcriptional regulator [Candidatus Competibacteraceae bacterium]|nr:MerR family transcriptional regulator [Candidatus Competibacteraceae bacterium]
MRDESILTGVVLEDACLTVEQVAYVCAISPDKIQRYVDEGLLPSRTGALAEWRFSSRELWRVRHIHSLERDFDAVPELAALVADLLEELDTLRARLRRARLG